MGIEVGVLSSSFGNISSRCADNLFSCPLNKFWSFAVTSPKILFGIQTLPSTKVSLIIHLFNVVYTNFSSSKNNLYKEYLIPFRLF